MKKWMYGGWIAILFFELPLAIYLNKFTDDVAFMAIFEIHFVIAVLMVFLWPFVHERMVKRR